METNPAQMATLPAQSQQGRRELRKQSDRPTWTLAILLGLPALITVLMFVVEGRELIGGLTVCLMLALMFMKVPVAFALAVPGVLGMLAAVGPRAVVGLLTDVPYDSTATWSLSVLPMFILMGMLLVSAGITPRIYTTARLWLGWMPGGLAVGTNVAGGMLAAVSGSTLGMTYALGRAGIPEMLRRGYHPRLAVGSVIAAGLPGQLIPPSTFLIIVAGITGASVGPQLIAGVLPGIVMVIAAVITIIVISVVVPKLAGRSTEQQERAAELSSSAETVTWVERLKSLNAIWPVAVLFVSIIGAIFAGVLTATEAGALGAFVALWLTVFFQRRNKPFKHIVEGAAQTVVYVGAIFLVLIGAHVLTRLVAVTGIGQLLSDMVVTLGLDRLGFLLVVMAVYFILGMFMDPLAILLLTIPILQPVFTTLEIDVLWFGVFAVIMGELAILTPPFGVLTFIMHTMVQNRAVSLGTRISLKDVFIGVSLFFPGIIATALLMIFFPDWVTWLPSLMDGG